MRVDGWHRLWIAACVVWAIVLGVITASMVLNAPSGSEGDVVRSMALLWLVCCVALLAIGHLVAWAIRGFRSDHGEPQP